MESLSIKLWDRPLVFVDDLDDPELADDDFHHFSRVLRVAEGDPIVLGDGAGGYRTARFARRPEAVDEIGHAIRPKGEVTIAFSPVKGERAEWFVQKLTELGVDEIVPVFTERNVVRWDAARAAKAYERMITVAREACLQSRRLHLPVVGRPLSLSEFLESRPGAVLADPSGRPMAAGDTTIVIGPEGGFTPAERRMAATIALPGHVLRADTAAVVAGALACDLRR